jgi:hypothetical protein
MVVVRLVVNGKLEQRFVRASLNESRSAHNLRTSSTVRPKDILTQMRCWSFLDSELNTREKDSLFFRPSRTITLFATHEDAEKIIRNFK